MEMKDDLENKITRPAQQFPRVPRVDNFLDQEGVGDVAHVEDSEEDAERAASKDAVPTVVLSVRKQSGTNTVEVAKNSRIYGPQATMAIQGGRRYTNLPAIVDERGTLTYKQVDDQSWALARGLQGLGVAEGALHPALHHVHAPQQQRHAAHQVE